ncbi:hypothetical protein OG792_30095 [Micromonospora sp. NBC_01699]|nr:hypothetical protein [Micromonospora sp. NBC_01699]
MTALLRGVPYPTLVTVDRPNPMMPTRRGRTIAASISGAPSTVSPA